MTPFGKGCKQKMAGLFPLKEYPFTLTLSDQIPLLGYFANSADPVQTPQMAASDQGLHCLLIGISMQNTIKM